MENYIECKFENLKNRDRKGIKIIIPSNISRECFKILLKDIENEFFKYDN